MDFWRYKKIENFSDFHEFWIDKQDKNRNEKSSNLSLGTHLTVLSKRLGRKRCCDATPDRCLEVCRLTIFASNCKTMSRLLPKIEGFGGIPGPEAYQIKMNTPNADACAVYKFHFQKWSFPRLERLCQPPKKIKASLSKVQAFKFILYNAASKVRFSKLQSSNSIF